MTCSDSTIGIRWLRPEEIRASWDRASARLDVKLTYGDEFPDASVYQTLPLSAPGEMIELTDAKGRTFGVLWSLTGLESTTNAALQAALAARRTRTTGR